MSESIHSNTNSNFNASTYSHAYAAEKQNAQAKAASPSIQELLRGPKAFYNQPDYLSTTKNDFAQRSPLPAIYSYKDSWRVWDATKLVVSVVIFPIGIARVVHSFFHNLAGRLAFIPAATPSLLGMPNDAADQLRSYIDLSGKWKYKRTSIEVNGTLIDVMIVGTTETFQGDRWTLFSNGNGEFLERKFANLDNTPRQSLELLDQLKSNGLFFNYAGVGRSGGSPIASLNAAAYRALLSSLNDRKKGFGASQVIGFGHSIGGAFQGLGTLSYPFNKDVQHVFVKSKTFSTMFKTVETLTNIFLAVLTWSIRWNIGSLESSKKLTAPEIILQSAHVDKYEVLTDSKKIKGDKVIARDATLAKALLDDRKSWKGEKVVIGVPEDHNDPIQDIPFLVRTIESMLRKK